ncbi:hypothetical protein ACH5AR_21115 [Kitasatospora sp. NPDC018619]|uniref:hypothetical protein n=1 Tax=Kitasatospora sp. NPDC018619 TaxID=3364028 RepID=UPI0037902CBB
MEEPLFTALVTGPGSGGPGALRAVGAVTGLSLWRGRLLLDGAPAAAVEGVPFGTAVGAARRLREAGVPAAVRCGWCERTVPDGGEPLAAGPCESRHWPAARCPANVLTDGDGGPCGTRGPACPVP